MKLGTPEECTSFLDALRSRGARGVKLAMSADGAVTGLELAFAAPERPPAVPHSPRQGPRQDDDEGGRDQARVRVPAGLGYSGI